MTKFEKALQDAGLKLNIFCKMWNIPYRTAQNWKLGQRRTPEWVFNLLELQRVQCSFCGYIFHINRNNPPRNVYCPSCGRTEKEVEEESDPFIFM